MLEKLTILGLQPAGAPLGLLRLETYFLYGLIIKLNLFTDTPIRDLALHNRKIIEDCSIAALSLVAEQNYSRYILTGILNAKSSKKDSVKGVTISLSLFDAINKRFLFENKSTALEFSDTDVPLAEISFTMAQLNPLINWAAEAIIRSAGLDSEQGNLTDCLWQHTICHNEKAFQALLQAGSQGKSIGKRVSLYEEALASDPQLEFAHLQLGKLYKDAKNYKQSTTHFLKVVEFPQTPPITKAIAATEAGICSALCNNYQAALAWWQQAIKLYPQYVHPYLNIALSLEERENYPDAVAYLSQAQTIAPQDIRAAYSLARIFSKTGDWQKALNQYQRQLATDKSDPWCYSNIATCYLQLEDMQNAIRYFQQVIDLDAEGDAGNYAKFILSNVSPSSTLSSSPL